MVRVAINGFGRIGRQVLQAGFNDPSIEWVAVNDLTDAKTLAYLLKYDSVHKRVGLECHADGNDLVVNGKRIKVFAEKDPEKLPWKDLGIDVVAECSGFFTDRDGAGKHLKAGAKKVLISAPAKGPDITLVKGVNEHLYDKTKHHIISNGSCTTNCVAPMVKVLHDNFEIINGYFTTTHAYTADQMIVDAPHKKDTRRGRSAAVSIVPTTSGAAISVTEAIPSLKGKLEGFAVRVPIPCGSIATFTCTVRHETSAQVINQLFESVAKFHLKGVLEYCTDPIVSIDIIDNPHSVIVDSAYTNVTEGTFVSVTGWYDNEWGYSNRMVDMLKLL